MNVEIPEYEMVLCKMTEEPIQEINNITNLEIKSYFANIDEISFSVPLYLTDDKGAKVRNELYDLIEGDMLVLLNDVQYFILTDPKVVSSNDGETSKVLIGFDRAYELAKKRLSGYDAVSRMLYDPLNRQDEVGLELGFLNYIENRTSWSVGYVNPNLLTKYRYLSLPRSTYLQAFQEVQRTYDCLFRFDTVNKVIDVYEITQLGDHKGLYISDENFISNLNQTINYDSIVTRLYLYGRDNISIQTVNITGQPYIQDFSFYKNTKYMSQDLIDVLDSYQNFISSKEDEFGGYLADLEGKTAVLGGLLDDLTELNTQLRVLQEELDTIIARGELSDEDRVDKQRDISTKQSEINSKQVEINNKESKISTVDVQIESIYESINLLKSQIDINAHFTQELKDELDPFIREDEYVDQNYTEETIQELFEDGKDVMEKVSRPKIQFEVQVEDFLQLVEGQHIWDKFILGDIATVEHKEIGFSYDVRLVGYTHNVDNNNLTLMFSNTNSIDDENLYLKDLLDNLNTTAGIVDYSKFGWYEGEEASTTINEYVNNALDLAKQSIVTAQGQRRLMDDRGIWLTKEEPDGSTSPKQMRLINNVLAITNDNWNTVDTAVTGDGINASVIRGHLGQFATISANKILMDEENGYISFGDLSNKPSIPTNPEDIGAKPEGWVPTWADIQAKPTILSANDIKTTVITKDWIGTLGLMVGSEIQMGDNASISWGNIGDKPSIPTKASDVGAKPDNWTPSWNEVTGKPSIPQLPSFITSTKITKTTIESPNISTGTITGGTINGADIYAGGYWDVDGTITVKDATNNVTAVLGKDGITSKGNKPITVVDVNPEEHRYGNIYSTTRRARLSNDSLIFDMATDGRNFSPITSYGTFGMRLADGGVFEIGQSYSGLRIDAGLLWGNGYANFTTDGYGHTFDKKVTVKSGGLDVTGTLKVNGTVIDGSISSRGETSMGNWVRFNDGTQICWIDVTRTNVAFNSPYGTFYRAEWRWVYPKVFSQSPVVMNARFKWGTGISWGMSNSSNTSESHLVSMDVRERLSGTNVQIQAMAIGRWK